MFGAPDALRETKMRWSKHALALLITATLAVSLLSMPVALGLPPGGDRPGGPAPTLRVVHTTPSATSDGMKTTATLVSTCGPHAVCNPIHVQLTYVYVDAENVTRYISIGKIVDPNGGIVEFDYPSYGEFVRITAAQYWCIRLSQSCGTTPATSTEIPVPTP